MGNDLYKDEVELPPYRDSSEHRPRHTMGSLSSASSTSLVLEHINGIEEASGNGHGHVKTPLMYNANEKYDEERTVHTQEEEQAPSSTFKVVLWTMCALCLGGWLLALFLFLRAGTSTHYSAIPYTPHSDSDVEGAKGAGNGKAITLDQVLSGKWFVRNKQVSWIRGAGDEDGLIMETGGDGRDYLVVEDVLSRKDGLASIGRQTLMRSNAFNVSGTLVFPNQVWPSSNLKKVLAVSDMQKNWRHSSTGLYWLFDVDTQTGEPLDPGNPSARIQLAQWSPASDAIVFTKDNDMYLRRLDSPTVVPITTDGGTEVFNGVPDWVYEEEVFQMNKATWWSGSGKYIAFLRTNETKVPEYPVQYFVSRPSGEQPTPGEENYPEVRQIKYPKAGAPNPVAHLRFYDVIKGDVFDVEIAGDYADDDRLITEIVWAKDGKVLVRETNRESDKLKVILIDVERRTGRTVREVDVAGLDGGWFEVSEYTRYVPGDPGNGRMHDGYIDTVIHEGYDHLAYFTPLDNPNPVYLTSGKWEVVKAPSSIDLKNNLVYFVAAKRGPVHRHVYSVKLDGTDMKALVDDTKDAYFDVSFSTGSGYALLSYLGPDIPKQKIIGTPSNHDHSDFSLSIEENEGLAKLAAAHHLPDEIFSTVTIDGFTLQVVERRPPHFDPNQKYPVVFYLYNGPGSQTVDKRFAVDFQSYLASNLNYLVVTVDGRGTGFSGRALRCIVRGNIGYWEAHDQIATAKLWAAKPYVDADRLAIWGWSYGGFMTLKTLELDAGATFRYGMAVAPVTDWRFYDSIYTERYMHTPQNNPRGYENSTITNMTALGNNVRFLVMHGVADDNVHLQSSLTLLDRLDMADVSNYDFHAFPDSDHGIYFHNAHRMVYGRLNDWLINAFNGEWLRTEHPQPISNIDLDEKKG